jgi:hypothetical protein
MGGCLKRKILPRTETTSPGPSGSLPASNLPEGRAYHHEEKIHYRGPGNDAHQSGPLHAAAYFFFLRDFYRAHPGLTEEFAGQLSRKPEELVWWAMAVTSLAMGFLITLAMYWSGARTFPSGLKYGSILAVLFWSSVNFGLYASSHFFSGASLFADTVCSVGVMTLAGGGAAWMLGVQTRATAERLIEVSQST